MSKSAREAGNEILVGLATIYNKDLIAAEYLLWDKVIFSKYDVEVFSRALMLWVEGDNAFFPKPGQIKALIAPEVSALEVVDLVKKSNPYEAPEHVNDHVRQAIINLGGWQRVCEQMPDESADHYLYLQYIKRIELALNQAKAQVAVHKHEVPPLVGINKTNQAPLALNNATDATEALAIVDEMACFSASFKERM